MMRHFYLMILLVSGYATHAQFTYNWEARAKAERERDNQAYIDARSKNTPYAPYTVDKEAIKKMVDSWSTKPSTTPEEKAYWERIGAERRKANAEAAIFAKELAKQDAQYDKIFLQEGFVTNIEERQYLISVARVAFPGLRDAALKCISELITAKKLFEANKNKLDCNSLLAIISSYVATFETALSDLDFVEKRFPQQKTQIDAIRLFCFAYYYGLPVLTYKQIADKKIDSFEYGFKNQDYKKEEMNDRFFEAAEMYPELATAVARKINAPYKHPFHVKLLKYVSGEDRLVKSKTPEAKKLAWLTITSIPPFDYKNNRNWEALKSYNYTTGYFDKLSVEEWKQISDASNGGAMDVVIKGFLWGTDLNVIPYLTNNWTKDFVMLGNDRDSRREFDKALKMVEKIAQAGEAQAINTLGVATAMGRTRGKKEDCIGLYKDAASRGSVWAQFNLVFAGGYNLKNYTEEDKQKAKDNFSFFIDNASPEVLNQAVDIVIRLGSRTKIKEERSAWYWYDAMPPYLIQNIINKAASQGNTNAQAYQKSGAAY